MDKPERGLRAKAGLYEDSDFIRGRRLTDAESWNLLFPEVPLMTKEIEDIVEKFANLDYGYPIEITPELIEKVNEIVKSKDVTE